MSATPTDCVGFTPGFVDRDAARDAIRVVRVEDGLIVERVQQADVLGQARQVYGEAFGVVGPAALLFRLP